MAVTLNTSLATPMAQDPLTCSGKHKMRLEVGAGNFSYALNLIKKHDEKANHTPDQSLAHSMVVTEYKKEIHCDDCVAETFFSGQTLCENFRSTAARIEELKKRGATVFLGIDATTMHQDENLKKYNFSRIHWNCPHDGSSMKDQKLPLIIRAFLISCATIQDPSDRVHITLAQPKETAQFYQGYYYDIVRAASMASYTLVKKRNFNLARYSNYSHVQTVRNAKASVTDDGMREFVFQKIDSKTFLKIFKSCKVGEDRIQISKLARELSTYSPKKPTIGVGVYYQETRGFYECSSDEDSSDYELPEKD